MEHNESSVIDTNPALCPSNNVSIGAEVIKGDVKELWIEGGEFYAMKLDVQSSVEMEVKLGVYMSAKIKCTILGKSYLCTKYISHPLYSSPKSDGSVIGVVVQSSTNVGPFVVQRIRLIDGMSSNICINDITCVNYDYVNLCQEGNSTSIYYKNHQLEHGTIVAMSKEYSGLIELVQLTYKMISNSSTNLVAKSFHNRWLSNILSISRVCSKTALFVEKDTMNGTEDGSFVSCRGSPHVSYVKDGICVVVNLATRVCRLFPVEPNIDTNLYGVFKSYIHNDTMYVDRALCPESCSIDDITGSHRSILSVSRHYTSNWREFTPRCCESIVVRPKHSKTPSSDTRDNAMSCLLHIFADRIDNIMQEISSKIIVIYGEPLVEFRTIMCKYQCFYVCQPNWDDDDGGGYSIFDLNEFDSLNVTHHNTIEDACNEAVPNSIAIVTTDTDCNGMKPLKFYVYTPSYGSDVISRNEYDIYLAIGVSKDVIKPFNSIVVDFNETNVSRILKSIHIEVPDTTIMFNPHIRPYIDLL